MTGFRLQPITTGVLSLWKPLNPACFSHKSWVVPPCSRPAGPDHHLHRGWGPHSAAPQGHWWGAAAAILSARQQPFGLGGPLRCFWGWGRNPMCHRGKNKIRKGLWISSWNLACWLHWGVGECGDGLMLVKRWALCRGLNVKCTAGTPGVAQGWGNEIIGED